MTKEIALFIYNKESGLALATFYHIINHYEHRDYLVMTFKNNEVLRLDIRKYEYMEV